MKSIKTDPIFQAVRITQKFGFISKDFYWNHITPKGRSTKYRYWSQFLDSGFFVPYKEINGSENFFYLNQSKLKKVTTAQAVGRRSPHYFYHDDKVMRFAFLLEASGLVANYWTEQEIKSDRLLALDLVGGNYSKLPDLIFDLNLSQGRFRFALEVEVTRKSNSRYVQSAFGYQSFSKIDFILFGVAQLRIKEAIRNQLNSTVISSKRKPYGFYDLSDFDSCGLKAPLGVSDKVITLEQFIKNLISICGNKSDFDASNDRENSGTIIPDNFVDSKQVLHD